MKLCFSFNLVYMLERFCLHDCLQFLGLAVMCSKRILAENLTCLYVLSFNNKRLFDLGNLLAYVFLNPDRSCFLSSKNILHDF
jgi:hypothetical protein